MGQNDFEIPTGRRCKLGRLMEQLDEEHLAKLQTALEQRDRSDSSRYSVSADRIVGALRDWGYSVRSTTIKTHRSKVCACQ